MVRTVRTLLFLGAALGSFFWQTPAGETQTRRPAAPPGFMWSQCAMDQCMRGFQDCLVKKPPVPQAPGQRTPPTGSFIKP